MQNTSSALVRLENLTKYFDHKKILDGFSLEIGQEEFVTLLGPSGCGKTTVLRLIAGLDQADSGDIWLKDQCITNLPAEHRHINKVFQNYALFPHMTVFENIAFGLRMQKVQKDELIDRVNEALKMVQLENYANRKPRQLSGGQQQRVAIARAVINKPQVLLLDEPLSALDYKLRQKMQRELKALQRQLGISFVFVTHDQEEALAISDRIVVMREGKIEQAGPPRHIYEEPKNLFVARFIGEINILKARVIEINANNRVLVDIEGWQRWLDINESVHTGQQINILLRPEDLLISEINDENKAPEQQGFVGRIIERNYKGMTLESTIELENGHILTANEFFNEDDPDLDHSLNQKVLVNWIERWEVVLLETDDE